MKIKNANNYFNELLMNTNKKYEIKIYGGFVEIFNDLKKRKFSEEQLKSIEEKIDTLIPDTIPDNRLKYYKLHLNKFKKYLREELSLIPKGYYTAVGLEIGAACGVVLGLFPIFWELVFGIETEFQRSLGVTFGIIIGTFIGLLIGKLMDFGAESRNRVLR